MFTKVFAPIFLAGAAVAAVALAPTAAAVNTAECADSALSSMCTKTGHAAIVATPGTNAGGNVGFWPFGAGPTPPIWALD